MDLTKPIFTARLQFRLLEEGDLAAINRQFSDPEMCKYFSEPPCTLTEAEGIIRHYRNPVGKGWLRYGLFHRETGDFIGTCGYHCWDRDLSQVEIGYDIWKEHWGQGYNSEALPELIKICFQHLGVEWIYTLIHPDNKASIASVRKFGFSQCPPCRPVDQEPQICLKLHRSHFPDMTVL